MTDTLHLRSLLNRLARLDDTGGWQEGLNPAQFAALEYLAQANRFSRSPSHLASYLAATRGTVSQTLKALERKGLVAETRSETDRRVVSYDLTEAGRRALPRPSPLEVALGQDEELTERLGADLEALLRRAIAANNGQTFGICRTCQHHQKGPDGRFCALLKVALAEPEAAQICHEHDPAPAE